MPNILPYFIKGGLHAYDFLYKIFNMAVPDKEIFSSLLSPTVHNDIASFVASHYHFAIYSDEPLYSLQSRFIVTRIGLNKAGMPAQHESLGIWVRDRHTLKDHDFIIERAPAHHSYAEKFANFSFFPEKERQKVLEAIQKALQSASRFTGAGTRVDIEETIPLLPIHSSILSSSQPQMSMIDPLPSSLVRAVALACNGSQSTSPKRLANDTISGCPPNTLLPHNSIRQFNPVGLTLFDVVVLAQVVHEYAPIYGLFDNQCSIFASFMFDSIVQLFSFSIDTPGPVPAPTPEVCQPGNANLLFIPNPIPNPNPDQADLAGRWLGFLIVDPIVKATIVSIVMEQFKTKRDLYFSGLE